MFNLDFLRRSSLMGTTFRAVPSKRHAFSTNYHTCVVIVRIRVYTSDIVIGTGIVYCTRNRSQTVVRGCLATSCCRRGGRGELVSWAFILEESRRVFIMR